MTTDSGLITKKFSYVNQPPGKIRLYSFGRTLKALRGNLFLLGLSILFFSFSYYFILEPFFKDSKILEIVLVAPFMISLYLIFNRLGQIHEKNRLATKDAFEKWAEAEAKSAERWICENYPLIEKHQNPSIEKAFGYGWILEISMDRLLQTKKYYTVESAHNIYDEEDSSIGNWDNLTHVYETSVTAYEDYYEITIKEKDISPKVTI